MAADFQLIMRDSAGGTINGARYGRGEVVGGINNNVDLYAALGTIGHLCDVFRQHSPGGQVSLEVARVETQRKLLPESGEFGRIRGAKFGAPPAPDPDAFVTTTPSVNGVHLIQGSTINGAVGKGKFGPPRNVTITVAGTAAQAGTSLEVTGELNGLSQTETIPVTAAAGTYSGVKAFDKVTKLTITGGTGTGASYTLGFGALLGLPHAPKTRTGAANVISEQVDGAKVTNGTFNAENGTYSPSSAANGARTYDVLYETA